MYSVLDLYCGEGGWSDGFYDTDFSCMGIDIVDVDYPYDLLLQDVRTIDGHRLKGKFDVIVGSPPCRDFSVYSNFSSTWKKPRDINNGLSMVYAFFRIVREAQPRFWVMENVVPLKHFIFEEPRQVVLMRTPKMIRGLWGVFPKCIFPFEVGKYMNDYRGSLRSWDRAKIPFCVSSTLAKTLRFALDSFRSY